MAKQKSNLPTRPIASTFQIVEAYKAIRTNLLFALATANSKVVIISSAEPNAGKSTAASNLAITMAQTGARVLLIDADMRKPSQHKVFRLKKANGLSMILSGLMTYEECVCREVAKGLDLITCGTLPPNPSELLGSEAMGNFLSEMQEHYDYIFVDTPPLCVVSDALVLSDKAAGIVLVCRQRQTTYEELQHAVDNVKDVQGNLLGAVITDMKENGRTYGKYDRYKYYKSYDYSYTSATVDGK
ncbi:MAG: CpsD/CapB family tyrosine-protein kinase [Clostridia bacterium]|nr:CpsD/CapB family tyrosine-protein kinase [Clostridia bacterium]